MNFNIKIKPTKIKDCRFYYNLRFNKKYAKFFFNKKKILFKEHEKWFAKNYKKNNYYTCYKDKIRIGYIRSDKIGLTCEISLAFHNKYQGKNYATTCYMQFEKKLKNNTILTSKVKKNNKKSIDFFIKNNFSVLKNQKKQIIFCKFFNKGNEKYNNLINKIENIRKDNNVNWMNILRLAFKNSPKEASNIFKNVFFDDKKINKLISKLY
tara:strand:+ start:3054 stop:3680 length:627 start_codon:yes stop_codon:yes gene_type:complete